MDQNEELIHNFESILKKQATKKPPGLYAGREKQDESMNKPKTPRISYRARDILDSVAKQMQAIQKADTASCKQVSRNLDKYKQRGFLPVDMMPVDEEVPTVRPNNFDTQFVSNTQLINIIENAEIIDKHRGVTQEFDSTFCQNSDEIIENYRIDGTVDREQNNDIVETNSNSMKVIQESEKQQEISLSIINVTSEMDTLTCLPNDINSDCDDATIVKDHQNDKIGTIQAFIDVNEVIEISDKIQDAHIPASPVFNRRRTVTPPLVYSLYTFEKFENLALPIIEKHTDLQTAKNLINSQIIGKELFIPSHIYVKNDEKSSVQSEVECLTINTGDRNTIKSNLDDEEKKTNAPKSYVDKNMEMDNIESNIAVQTEFKDELLFSSDEEEDYAHKDIKELPLTCALETSFYDKSDVLDKTMYVGFQTASNKSIQISTDSFSKAKSILSDVDSNRTSLKELVEIFDSGKEKSSNVHNSYLSGDNDECHSITNKQNSNIECRTSAHMSDLKIESGEEMGETLKSICLTALKQDVARKDHIVMSQVIEFKSVLTPRLKERNYALKNSKKRKLEGFKTASNKLIKLSDKALAQCKKVFQDIDLEEDYEPVLCEPDLKESKEVTVKIEDAAPSINLSQDIFEISNDSDKEDNSPKTNSEKEDPVISQINDVVILQEFEDNDMNFEETNNNGFMGFKTASKKDIVISEGALVNTKDIFQDILTIHDGMDSKTVENATHCNTDPNETVFKKPELGLKIATNTKVKESKEQLTLSRDENNFDFKKRPTDKFIGFKTAANKEIKISKEALKKTKNFYKDVDEEFTLNAIEGKQVITQQDLKDDLETEKKIVEELALNEDFFEDNIVESEKLEMPVFIGFQTASKKIIAISETALAKSKKLFEDIADNDKDDELGSVENKMSKVFKKLKHDNANDLNKKYKDCNLPLTCSDVKFQNNKIILASHKLEDAPIHQTEVSIFNGFQTASNKKVKISDEALARSKKIFQDMELSQSSNARRDTVMPSNSDVVEQEKVFDESENFFKITQGNCKNGSDFVGLKTATLKPVKISTESFVKSRQMLNEFEPSDVGNMTDKGVSSHIVHEPASFNFVGFQTGNKNNVKISAEALAKGKKLFSEFELTDVDKMVENDNTIPKLTSNCFVGFQTASNKNIHISAESLAKSKQLLSEFEFKDVSSKAENDDIIPTPASSKFFGFQSASNKEVHISEDALVKSKQIFNDIEFKDNRNQINNDINDILPSTSSKFVGFHTASNKVVEISHDALIKCKKIFSGIDNYEIETIQQKEETSPVFRGFQTASNKKVVISEKALRNSKELFKDLEIESDKKCDSTVENCDAKLFKGFQTASNKRVVISEKALAKSKKLFEDIEISQLSKPEQNQVPGDFEPIIHKEFNKFEANRNILNDVTENKKNCDLKPFKGFQTASNKKVTISEQALNKTKLIFNDTHEAVMIENENDSRMKPEVVYNNSDHKDIGNGTTEANINKDNSSNKDIIDTQVLNDFQDSLNTEDFCKSTPKSKRSGSPILSCPRAKKRRFATPYKSEKKIEPKNTFIPPKLANTYKFKDNYKKDKKYTLRDLEEINKDAISVIDPYVSTFNFERLTNFEFFDARNDYTCGKIDINELKKFFLDAVNKKIVPDGWLVNHVRLIIWKLLSYEIKFPNSMKNVCTVRNVLEQLKYRYDKELFNVERPILRKILEKDDVPSKTMVLCVAEIYADNSSVIATNTQNIELLLTDGWYTIRACLDRMLCRQVCQKTIVVGCKLATSGAELIGCEQGKAPWEDLSSVRLKLSGNSTRRARWFVALGGARGVIRCGLRGARGDGGRAAVTAFVARVYPPLYAERREGSTVTLSERLEHIRQVQFETQRQTIMEKIYEELEKELDDQESQDSEGYTNENTNCLESGSQISKIMKKSRDPDEYRAQLTVSQNQMLEEHNARRRERQIEKIRVKFREKLDKTGLNTERNVVPLLKVRIADFKENHCGVEVTTGYLSIWKPSPAVVEIVTEGAWIEILNVIPTGVRNSEIQLSAGRQTIFRPHKLKTDKFKLHTEIIKRKCYKIKELAENPCMSTYFNEIDTTGMIFLIEPPTKEFDEKKSNFQNVFLADADKNMICVYFWGGIKKFGFEYVIDTGQVLTCVNLQKRAGNTRKSIPQYRVTEFTCFTKTPKNKHASEMTKELTAELTKIKDKFCEDCIALKNNYTIFKTRNNENVSPYRFDARNVSPLRCDANLNLTGLDFESSFKDPEISPMALLRKKQVNEKIQKLRMYGEPPPLSTIHIINKSKNASANYKSPLVKSSVASAENQNLHDVASVEKGMGLQDTTSPVCLNRTYVKKMNPVKLNFSSSVAIENDLNDSADHFAEEFESSPPLSLDSDVLL